MSAQPAAAARRPLARASDTELLARLRAGEEHAFTALCDRHGADLARYARRILRTQPDVVDDVVQESLLRAHRALLRDDRHIQVRPYLFRLVRNCCLDELARVSTDSVALHLLAGGDEPRSGEGTAHDVALRRSATRDLLADLAALPATQRHALVRRELDGLTHEQIAAELGVSIGASKNLVHRARETLTRTSEARDARCSDIRHELLSAHDRGRRPSMRALRHVSSCRGCRAFRVALKSERRTLRVLAPAPALALLAGAKAMVLLGGGAKSAAVKGTAVATAGALAVGGAVELGAHVFGPGSRSPLPLHGVALPGAVPAGGVVPAHTAVVTRRLVVPRGGVAVSGSLGCPGGMRVAGLVPAGGAGLSRGLDPATVVGASTTARVFVSGARLEQPRRVTVAIICRAPDRNGSVRARAATTVAAPIVFTCRRRASLLARARGRGAVGTVTARQPLAVLGAAGSRLRVRTDAGATGWLPQRVAC